jgi:hydroxymethylpyrimidine pyrophosphatase-like HAD family hydrolase
VSEETASSADCPASDTLELVAAPSVVAQHDGEDGRCAAPPPAALPEELAFYRDYAWTLNPHLSFGETIERLQDEIARLARMSRGWQTDEVATNIFLLACGMLNSVDEYLREPSLRLPWKVAALRLGRGARWVAENSLTILRPRRRAKLRGWREAWLDGLHDFLRPMVADETSNPDALVSSASRLSALLHGAPLSAALRAGRVGVPSPFRRLDLTHRDVLALGRRYVQRFPDRSHPILLLGLRTSGSYFSPLLRAFLAAEGFTCVAVLTMVPGKGPGRRERKALERFARQGYTAVILDDSPHTGGTIFTAFDIARRAGFATNRLKALIPAHPARPNWYEPLGDDTVISLAPEDWHKRSLLTPTAAQDRLAEYFRAQGFVRTSVVDSSGVAELNERLAALSSDERGARLKRVFEVHLETGRGERDVRYVVAKSVGWGWLGYHAFLAGYRLSGLVPPILGLRDGILYAEWIAQDAFASAAREPGKPPLESIGAYVAARACRLGLPVGPAGSANLHRHDNGIRLLGKALSRAHGVFGTDLLMRARIERRLRRRPCPVPTLIDGKMLRGEWIVGPHGPLKTDFEHHGLGKEELNVIDPAYDLAESILEWDMSQDEERRLIRQYVAGSGDPTVEQRLFVQKLLAGLWAMKQAREHMFARPRTIEQQQAFHQRFMRAWNFLTVEAARHCGAACAPAARPQWRAPLVALDIDGVIDERIFGFPCTTAAGIKALSLLRHHGISVALNSARSVAEIQAYCDAYGLAGGVAEHGGYIWDAVRGRGRTLLADETLRQLDELRSALRRIPGVFLDDRHRYSIRAFTYVPKPRGILSTVVKSIRSSAVGDGALAPLPALLINHLMTDLGLDRLSFHHTSIDTTVVARETDKGSGLVALRDWVLGAEAETVAVGDQQPDLTAFRVATRGFAPANIACAREARLLGCRIARRSHQQGLLEIACTIVTANGRDHRVDSKPLMPPAVRDDAFAQALRAADRGWAANLLDALFGRR